MSEPGNADVASLDLDGLTSRACDCPAEYDRCGLDGGQRRTVLLQWLFGIGSMRLVRNVRSCICAAGWMVSFRNGGVEGGRVGVARNDIGLGDQGPFIRY